MNELQNILENAAIKWDGRIRGGLTNIQLRRTSWKHPKALTGSR